MLEEYKGKIITQNIKHYFPPDYLSEEGKWTNIYVFKKIT